MAFGTDDGEPSGHCGDCANVERFGQTWLLANSASGSNSPVALEKLKASLGDHGLEIANILTLPSDPLPTPGDLDAARVSSIVIYTGDGTLNAALSKLRGWTGAVLVLPGGTKNLLSKRLHGDFPAHEIIQINGYSATTPAELAQQGWALLRREFRDGPHDRLGIVDEVTLENVDGSPVEVLLDGEACEAAPRPTFRVALSEVELLATHHG